MQNKASKGGKEKHFVAIAIILPLAFERLRQEITRRLKSWGRRRVTRAVIICHNVKKMFGNKAGVWTCWGEDAVEFVMQWLYQLARSMIHVLCKLQAARQSLLEVQNVYTSIGHYEHCKHCNGCKIPTAWSQIEPLRSQISLQTLQTASWAPPHGADRQVLGYARGEVKRLNNSPRPCYLAPEARASPPTSVNLTLPMKACW